MIEIVIRVPIALAEEIYEGVARGGVEGGGSRVVEGGLRVCEEGIARTEGVVEGACAREPDVWEVRRTVVQVWRVLGSSAGGGVPHLRDSSVTSFFISPLSLLEGCLLKGRRRRGRVRNGMRWWRRR